MTVSYQYEVASSTSGGFTRLLLMWRGSLYKLIYRELFLFLALFAALSAVYRHVFTEEQKKEFEQVVIYCDTFIKLIPLSFVLGFYVSYVAQRWWKQYQAIPWPDKVMHLVALYVTGDDEYGRMLRRALMRYLNLSLILVLRSISSAVKRRFPTLDHVVDSGFMTSLELELFQSVPSVEFNTYWIPCTWFVNLLKEARRSHRVPDPQGLKLIMEEFNDFRTKCGLLWSYDWVSIPLVYTQVVTLATYSFFAVALIGRQYIEGAEKQFQLKIDIYLPIFTVLQFFFFMGLLKVAEQLINPFGDDDEDFELNWLIDRHTKAKDMYRIQCIDKGIFQHTHYFSALQVSYLGVDTLMNRCPPLVKDIYFDSENLTLPYTEAAAGYKRKTYRGSVANMTVPEEKQTMFLPDIVEEEEDLRLSPTPRTSTASLATHANESPVAERRQISGSPQTPPRMHHNASETILQLDLQDAPAEVEQRRSTADPVKKFSFAKCSTPRIDQVRKPFFAMAKTPRVILQPWPSATNLSRSARQIVDTPIVADSDVNPWRGCPSKVLHSPTLQVPTAQPSPEAESQDSSFRNLAFSEDESHPSCDCDSANANGTGHSDVCLFQCHHGDICQHLSETPETPEPTIKRDSREERASGRAGACKKYLVRRHKSTGEPCGRKANRWRQIIEARQTKLRRKTADSIMAPPNEISLAHAISSPNLRAVEGEEVVGMKEVSDAKVDDKDCEKGDQISRL